MVKEGRLDSEETKTRAKPSTTSPGRWNNSHPDTEAVPESKEQLQKQCFEIESGYPSLILIPIQSQTQRGSQWHQGASGYQDQGITYKEYYLSVFVRFLSETEPVKYINKEMTMRFTTSNWLI